jgi:glycosyltransferase involved in cell wall biosynthesis
MISVITPAHNEERYITKCLESVRRAARQVAEPVEHIVVLNRCTDRTAEIAESLGAKLVHEDARNLSRIRNVGVSAAQGDIVATIDADSWMSTNMLATIREYLDSGRYIGGGVRIYPERLSLGILCSVAVIAPYLIWSGVSAGMFWCRRKDFDAIGGFNEQLISVEDVDFGQRLKRFGKSGGKRYGTIRKAHMVTSCRKFDELGDWYFARRPWRAYRIIRGQKASVDHYFYDMRN